MFDLRVIVCVFKIVGLCVSDFFVGFIDILLLCREFILNRELYKFIDLVKDICSRYYDVYDVLFDV